MMDKTLDESIGWGSHVWNDAIMFLEKPFHPSHRLKDDSDGDNDDMTMILILLIKYWHSPQLYDKDVAFLLFF